MTSELEQALLGEADDMATPSPTPSRALMERAAVKSKPMLDPIVETVQAALVVV